MLSWLCIHSWCSIKCRFFEKLFYSFPALQYLHPCRVLSLRQKSRHFWANVPSRGCFLLAVMFVNVKSCGQPWNRLCLTLKQCIDYTIFLLSLWWTQHGDMPPWWPEYDMFRLNFCLQLTIFKCFILVIHQFH